MPDQTDRREHGIAEMLGAHRESGVKLLYIDIDTLRPDHLGCYGYERPTSPNIDALARRGVRFDRVYTSDSPCLPARSALQTGMFGIHNGAVGHGGTAADTFNEGLKRGFRSQRAYNSFAALLARSGTWTTTISVFGQHHSALQWYAGFNEAIQDGYGSWMSEGVTPLARDWIARNAARRESWFLHVHVWDPHTPYIAEPKDAERLGNRRPDWITPEVLARHRSMAGPHTAQETLGFEQPGPAFASLPLMPGNLETLGDVDRIFDGYDTGIRRSDEMVGVLLNDLDSLGVLDDTAVLVASDHGESFGELGIYADHQTADEITHHVPAVLAWPGLPGAQGGQVEDGLHYQVDLGATIVELCGAEVPDNWDGESFAASLRGNGAPSGRESGREKLILSHAAWTVQRSVRWDDWLCIRTAHDGFHGFPEVMLFDVRTDPHLQHDVADQHPEVVADAMAEIETWRSAMLDTSVSGVDPHDTVLAEGGPFHVWGELPAYLVRLRNTGRGPLADQLEARWPDEAHGAGPHNPGPF